jgi:hypothetical protein
MPPASDRPGRTSPRSPRPRRRRGLVTLLLVAGIIAALGCSVAVWLNRQAISNQGWAQTSPHLLADAHIRAAVGTFAVDELFQRTHVASALHSLLPAGLADAALSRLRSLGRHLAAGILASRPARAVWNTANRQAHRQLLEILDHGGRGREVSLDLTPLLSDLVRALENSAPVKAIPSSGQLFTLGSPHTGQIPLLTSDQVEQARGAVNAVRGASIVLALAAIALFAAAVAAAGGWRSVALACVGWCLIAVGALVLVARFVLAPLLADGLAASSTYRPAVKATWTIATTELRTGAVATLIGGGILLIVGLTSRALTARRG